MFTSRRRIPVILSATFAAVAGVAAIVEIMIMIRRHEALATPYVLGLIAMAFLLGGLFWRQREGLGTDARAEARTPNGENARAEARTPNEGKISLSADSVGSLFDLFPILVWRCGPDGRCNYFNHAYLAFTGRTLAEESGEGWSAGIHPEDADHCLGTRAKAFQARTAFSVEYRLRHHDGRYHWILDVARPYYDTRGDFAGFIGSCFSLTERKQIENDMRQYQKAFEHAEDPISIIDRGLNYQAVNRAFLRFFNMRREDAIGRPVREVVGAEFYDAVHAEALAEALAGRVATRECPRRYPGAGDRFMSFVYIPLPEADGRVGAVVLMSRDITAQKSLDQEREVTVEMLRLLNTQEDSRTTMEGALSLMLNHSGCAGGGIRIFDGTDFPFRVSQGLGGDFLQSENTLLPLPCGQTRTDTDPAADGGGCARAELAGLCGEVLRGVAGEGRPGFSAGGSFWTGGLSETFPLAAATLGAPARGRCLAEGFESLALIPLKVEDNIFGLIHLCDPRRDRFSARAMAFLERLADSLAGGIMRKMITEAHARLATAAEQAGEGIIITDTAGIIQYVNPAFERLTGYACAEALGRDVAMLRGERPDQEAVHAELCRALEAGAPWTGRMTGLKKDGKTYEEEATWSPVRDAAGRTINYVSIHRDISIERSLEAQLRQATKMEAVGRLAGGVAHDFNNLLTAISGYAEMIRLKLNSNHPAWSDLAEILKAAERAGTLTRQLLTFSRKQVLQPCLLDLNTIVADLQKMLIRLIGEDIELVAHLAPSLERIQADRGQIEQVLVNLAVNARDAMAGGGKLTVETCGVTIEKEYLQQHVGVEPGRYILLTVSDTGCGMDTATQNHIFEPFFTTKEAGKGTGLGLSTVYGIVRQSGGFITVYSEPGHGTTFKIYLPRASEQTAPAPAPGLSPSDTHGGPRRRSETILLVEDDQTVRQLIAHYLNSVGCQMLVAAAPGEALDLVRDFEGPIHLMITDVIMPQMSGRVLANLLRPQRPEMKVLFISGYTENAILDQGNLEAGSAFLQKPFTVATLSRQLRKILDL